MDIRLSSKKTVKILATGIAVLLFLHLFFQIANFAFGHNYCMGLLALFDLHDEHNIPTVYSFLLLLSAAKLMGYLAYNAQQRGEPFATHWAGLCILFVCLALDEILVIHEMWAELLRIYFHASGLFYCPWQIPYVLLVMIFFPIYRPFWKSLPGDLKRIMLIAAGLYLSAVIGFEVLEEWYYNGDKQKLDFVFMLFATAEETLEMVGVVVLIYGLLEYMRNRIGTMRIQLER